MRVPDSDFIDWTLASVWENVIVSQGIMPATVYTVILLEDHPLWTIVGVIGQRLPKLLCNDSGAE